MTGWGSQGIPNLPVKRRQINYWLALQSRLFGKFAFAVLVLNVGHAKKTSANPTLHPSKRIFLQIPAKLALSTPKIV